MMKFYLKVPRKLVLKVFILLFVSYTIFVSLQSSLQGPVLAQYKLNLQRSMKLKFKLWYNNFLSSQYHLESDPGFLKQMEEIRKEKLDHDLTNELWFINDKMLANLPLEVSIPQYYFDDNLPRPIIQPFDPRFTIGVYLNFLRHQANRKKSVPSSVPFHWSDWVDMSKLHKYILNPLKDSDWCSQLFDLRSKPKLIEKTTLIPINKYCKNNKQHPLGFEITEYTGPQTPENRELLGKAYLYTSAPPPLKIIFLANNDEKGSFEVEVANNNQNSLQYGILNSNVMQTLVTSKVLSPRKKLNVLSAFKKLFSTSSKKNPNSQLSGSSITIPDESFHVDPKKELLRIRGLKKRTDSDMMYMKSLEFSIDTRNPPKFFEEAKLLENTPNKWLGEHYDWRFFNGLTVGNDEQLISLHRLVKNYLNFARQNGIITWIAHGSLLSWYWNGIAFPWDTDIDVQMPISELYKLGHKFNQTLVVENVGDANFKFDGLGRFFIDVGSSISHRSKGNGNNNIDARFIDIDTGLYIDITGLAITDTPAPSRYDNYLKMDPKKNAIVEKHIKNHQLDHFVKNQQLRAYNCRNNHFSTYEELSPLTLTVVENQLSYIPSNFVLTLNYEYDLKGITEKNFKDYIYLNNYRMWIKTRTVLDYMTDPRKWMNQHNSTLNNPKIDPEQEKKTAEELQEKDDKDNKNETEQEKAAREKAQKERAAKEKASNESTINKLTLQDHVNLLQSNRIFKEFYKTMKLTKFHEEEIRKLLKSDFKGVEALLEAFRKQDGLGTGLRPDLFINKLQQDTDKQDFTREISKIMQLAEVYQHDTKTQSSHLS
ncbi:regulator of cell wall mannosyl phosphorylation [Scheffersomyces xylosifermentans]|uniref:regulator of cell wall mannosyl phosphorylation n=1 Tax=Scheffersomyces xylosifermentans TaxID=1304137 RepID=UPI00315CDB52